ncbi:MAG TPA: hypothetical protein VKA15_07810, partial [Isosphaeraceae bacterium]|nr:hypothetical protein [Isosphaeraceae bacterium]
MVSSLKAEERTSASSGSSVASRNDDHPGIALVRTLWGDLRPREFAVRFWDGATWEVEAGCPCRFTLVLESPEALSKMVTAHTDLALGEAYIFRDIDLEGDVESALDLADEIVRQRNGVSLANGIRIWLQLRRLKNAHR